MMMAETMTVVLGRQDYGGGVIADLVTIDGEEFAVYRGAYFSACGFCSPTWSGSKTHYAHVFNAVCFQCNGRGYHRRYESRAKVEALVKRRKADRARAERKRAAEAAAKDAARAAWAEAHPDEAALLDGILATGQDSVEAAAAAEKRWGDFLWSLAHQSQHRPLSEKQTAAVVPAVARVAARESAAAAKAAAQRYYDGPKVAAAAGTVVTAITTNGYAGSSSRLVVVEGTGEHAGVTFKMFGTGVTLWETRRGDKVEVTGTVKAREVYEGTMQTVLTRAKVVVTEAADA
jgi:hypothetical protein